MSVNSCCLEHDYVLILNLKMHIFTQATHVSHTRTFCTVI